MTVQQLIEKLNGFDKDRDVVIMTHIAGDDIQMSVIDGIHDEFGLNDKRFVSIKTDISNRFTAAGTLTNNL